MYAIIETGGKQYQVEEERYVDVELLDAEVDAKVEFDNVVMIVDGDNSQVGQPYVEGVKVTAKVLKHDKDKKIIVYKQKRKKGYRRKQGHRQQFTRIMIESIGSGKAKAKKAAATEEAPAEEKKAPAKKTTTAKKPAAKTTTAKKTEEKA